jgi:hypothetical protein
MFNGITFGDWGQIAVGLAAIVAAIFYSKRQIDKRKFVYQIKTTPIIQIDGVSSDDIEIRFKGRPVKTLNLYSVSVLNLGNRPILKNDWDENLTISFATDLQIVDFRIGASKPRNLNPSFAINEAEGLNEIRFQPFLLNSREGFRSEIVVAGEDVPKITSRIVGISKIEHLDVDGRNFFRSVLMVIGMISISWLLTYLGGTDANFLFGIMSPSSFGIVIGLLFGLWVIFFGRKFPTPLHLDEEFLERLD